MAAPKKARSPKARNDLAAKYVRSLLRYNPRTGLLWWKVKHGKRTQCGTVAGRLGRSGYRSINIDKKPYLAHRLAWLIVTGKWPHQIDHKNHKPSDNRWTNIREATFFQNGQNRGIHRRNRSGYKGIFKWLDRNKWGATIQAHGKKIYLGTFDTPQAASAAYRKAAKKLHGRFAKI